MRRKFFIQFTLLTLLGWIAGGIASIVLENTQYAGAKFFSPILFAIIFGADQALVLNKYISGWLWMLATSTGWLIANAISVGWINYIQNLALSVNQHLSPNQAAIVTILSTFSFILSGIWLGFSQWLVLRRYTVNAWWWNFIPSISFCFISIFLWLLSSLQNLIPALDRHFISYLAGQGFTALTLGAIPAIGICRLKGRN